MARLLGFIANRPDLCRLFIDYERETLRSFRAAPGTSLDDAEPWGWGTGFFQQGEVLLKRRPLDERGSLDWAEVLEDIRSDIIVGQIRQAEVGSLRTDNTHPFRYRQWVFANTGRAPNFASYRAKLMETLPSFLQRSLRGDTDSELLFHLFLSFLHDAARLEHPMVAVNDVFPALKSSLSLLDRIGQESGAATAALNVLLATPEYLVVAHRGAPMAYRLLAGREDFEPLFDQVQDGKMRKPDLEPCRLCVVASDFGVDRRSAPPPNWTVVPEGAMVAFSRTDEPVVIDA
ncbi:MAG: class II glutamine amidotransferase [Myxococcota bacterium]